MSRPSSSVPNQCAPLGGCKREGRSILLGFCGAIHGANNANTTNTATSTMPMDASTLRRPKAAAVFHVVESAIAIQSPKNLTAKDAKVAKKIASEISILRVLSALCGEWFCQLLFANCYSHQLFQRAEESLILFRRANAHAYGIRRAPWHQRSHDHAFSLHAFGE